jgi:hypothetical protein
MSTSARFLSGLATGAILLAGIIGIPAMAAEKGEAKVTTLLDNDKVTVREVHFQPGDENKTVATSAYRVLRALKGGTVTRTYADGKTEKLVYKTGDVKFLEPLKIGYTAKNTGKSDVLLYVVQLK